MIHVNTILRVLFQRTLMLPRLQLRSVFEQAAKTVMACYKIVVPYKSVSFLSLLHSVKCVGLLCTKIWHQIVLVVVLKCVLFHRRHCGLLTKSRFSLEIISSICKSLFQHYSIPIYTALNACFMYNLRGLYSHILKIEVLFFVAILQIFHENHFLPHFFKGSVNIWSILLLVEIKTS
jgi:hypothetical protein